MKDRRPPNRCRLFVAVIVSLLSWIPAPLSAGEAGPERSGLAEASDPAVAAAPTAPRQSVDEGQPRAAHASALDAPPDAPLHIEERVTVTASRTERDVFDEPFIVELVSEEDSRFRKKVGGFVDTFEEMPAVWVQKTSQGQGSPFIRGFTGFHNLLLVDGIRLNSSIFRSGPNQYWATIDSNSAGRVELVKGPAATLYGSDAVGGTVNVLTRSGLLSGEESEVRGGLYFRGATAERAGAGRAEMAGSHGGRLGYLVGGSVRSFGDFEAGGGTGTVEESAYDDQGADARLDYLPRNGGQLTLVVQSYRQRDVPRTEATVFAKPFRGTSVGADLRRDLDQERDLAYVRYRAAGWRGIDEAEYTVSYQRTEEDEHRVRSDRRFDLSGFDVGTLGAQVRLFSVTSAGSFTYGVDGYRDSVDSFRTAFDADGSVRRRRVQGEVADDASYEALDVYVQDQIELAQQRFSLDLGARFSRHTLAADKVEDPLTGAAFSLKDDWSSVVGSLRVLWRPDPRGADRWHFFASVAQGFRAPNLSDLTMFDSTSALETPTPGLGPEKYVNVEVGAKARGSRGSLSGALFQTFMNDQIVQSPTGRFIDGAAEVQKSNVGDGFVHGVEVEGQRRLSGAFELWGNLSWLEGRVDQFLFDQDGGATEVRRPVSRLVPWMSSWGLRYARSSADWWVELHGTAFARADQLALRDMTDVRRIPPGGTPGFAVIGLRGALELLRDRLVLAAGVENLLDEEYRIHGSGQNMPGRNLVISVGWR